VSTAKPPRDVDPGDWVCLRCGQELLAEDGAPCAHATHAIRPPFCMGRACPQCAFGCRGRRHTLPPPPGAVQLERAVIAALEQRGARAVNATAVEGVVTVRGTFDFTTVRVEGRALTNDTRTAWAAIAAGFLIKP
jgi:hypothetical protein